MEEGAATTGGVSGPGERGGARETEEEVAGGMVARQEGSEGMSGTIGAVMEADLAIDVLEALEMYAARVDRECEVMLGKHGGGELMASEFTRSEYRAAGR